MKGGIGWLHPKDESDQWDGFNDSGIEHFRGNPLPSLAREVVQNSLDAAATYPVIVEFNKKTIPTSSIPDLAGLKAAVGACDKHALHESEKAEEFFSEAIKILSKQEISVLQIIDRNTTGIKGPCVNGYPFYAFMKASGQSVKKDPTATGSYGIGKSAPFAVSALRTIFVSTKYRDEMDGLRRLTQGKSILMSHDIEGERRRGQGFWGVEDRCMPVVNQADKLPDWLRPELKGHESEVETGTALSILGFKEYKYSDWQKIISASIAENFFSAILRGSLIVHIDDAYTVNAHNISDYLQGDFAEAMRDEKGEPERIENCSLYLKALEDSVLVHKEAHQNRELGYCELRILVDEALPKRVCALRNGMFITDQLALF